MQRSLWADTQRSRTVFIDIPQCIIWLPFPRPSAENTVKTFKPAKSAPDITPTGGNSKIFFLLEQELDMSTKTIFDLQICTALGQCITIIYEYLWMNFYLINQKGFNTKVSMDKKHSFGSLVFIIRKSAFRYNGISFLLYLGLTPYRLSMQWFLPAISYEQ